VAFQKHLVSREKVVASDAQHLRNSVNVSMIVTPPKFVEPLSGELVILQTRILSYAADSV
jgi:hypothetical protein